MDNKNDNWSLDYYSDRINSRIVIPKGVRRIRDISGPSYRTYHVEKIDIPETVTEIADSALKGCESLRSITLPSGLERIGNESFANCTSLKKVTIPASVKFIGECAFSGCLGIQEFQVDEDNPYYCAVDGVLFNKDCTELIQFPLASQKYNYQVPSTVVRIAQFAFANLRSQTCVTIPATVKEIGSGAFDTGWGVSRIFLCVEEDSHAEEYLRNLWRPIPFKYPRGTAIFIKPLGLRGLFGKTICVTGKLNSFASREILAMHVTSLGGKISSSVTPNTDYLITNTPDSGSSKNRKAAELGIPVLTEDTFLQTFF